MLKDSEEHKKKKGEHFMLLAFLVGLRETKTVGQT
jgi:hypothetical protein